MAAYDKVGEWVGKLTRVGIEDIDKLPLGTLKALGDLSDEELRALAKAQRAISGSVVNPLGIGYFLF